MSRIIAIVRKPGPSFKQAISANPRNLPIDIKLACLQHDRYVAALKKIKVAVISLPSLQKYPDGPFVEDTTVILDHVALACPNKEKSRQGEGSNIHKEIKKFMPIEKLTHPVTLDGGDVLTTEEEIFVGISDRTNRDAIDALAKFTQKPVIPVEVFSGLHLKTSVSYLGNNILVLDPSSIDISPLRGFKWIEIGKPNRYSSNCLAIGDTVLLSKRSDELANKIRQERYKTIQLDISEFEKADGGLTCMSIIFKKM